MDFEKLTFVDEFSEGQKVYRYMDLNWLLESVITLEFSYSTIKSWSDKEPYEAAYWKKLINGETKEEWTDDYKNILAQSWTTREESDAMWRIYGNHGDTVKIQTSIQKLSEIERVHGGIIGKVRYFSDANEFLIKLRELEKIEIRDHLKYLLPALLKPAAYSHEEEVRILFHRDFVPAGRYGENRESFKMISNNIIEEIVFDPRMGDWKASILSKYFDERKSSIPNHKSTLYDSSLKDLPTTELFWAKP